MRWNPLLSSPRRVLWPSAPTVAAALLAALVFSGCRARQPIVQDGAHDDDTTWDDDTEDDDTADGVGGPITVPASSMDEERFAIEALYHATAATLAEERDRTIRELELEFLDAMTGEIDAGERDGRTTAHERAIRSTWDRYEADLNEVYEIHRSEMLALDHADPDEVDPDERKRRTP